MPPLLQALYSALQCKNYINVHVKLTWYPPAEAAGPTNEMKYVNHFTTLILSLSPTEHLYAHLPLPIQLLGSGSHCCKHINEQSTCYPPAGDARATNNVRKNQSPFLSYSWHFSQVLCFALHCRNCTLEQPTRLPRDHQANVTSDVKMSDTPHLTTSRCRQKRV